MNSERDRLLALQAVQDATARAERAEAEAERLRAALEAIEAEAALTPGGSQIRRMALSALDGAT